MAAASPIYEGRAAVASAPMEVKSRMSEEGSRQRKAYDALIRAFQSVDPMSFPGWTAAREEMPEEGVSGLTIYSAVVALKDNNYVAPADLSFEGEDEALSVSIPARILFSYDEGSDVAVITDVVPEVGGFASEMT